MEGHISLYGDITDFIYGYMASDIQLKITLVVVVPFPRLLLPVSSHGSTYRGLCKTSCGTLAGIKKEKTRKKKKSLSNEHVSRTCI